MLDPNLDTQLICKAQPIRVAHNGTFIVDCSVLKYKKDLADDLGVLASKGLRKTTFGAFFTPGYVQIATGYNGYVMHCAWHTHGTSGDLRRLVVFIEGKNAQV